MAPPPSRGGTAQIGPPTLVLCLGLDVQGPWPPPSGNFSMERPGLWDMPAVDRALQAARPTWRGKHAAGQVRRAGKHVGRAERT